MIHKTAIHKKVNLPINTLIKVRVKIGKDGDKYILRSDCGKVGFITNMATLAGQVAAGQDWCCQIMQDGPTYFKGNLTQRL